MWFECDAVFLGEENCVMRQKQLVRGLKLEGSLSSAFLLWVTLIGWWPPESPQPLVLGEYFRKLKLNVKEKLQYFEQKDHTTQNQVDL